MGKQKVTEQNTQGTVSNIVAVRFSPELLARLDNEVKKQQAATPWAEMNRAVVVREAVFRFLGASQENPQAPTPRTSSSVASQKVSSGLPESIAGGVCRVCNNPLPEGRKALCGKERCSKEDKNARERIRRQQLREDKSDQ